MDNQINYYNEKLVSAAFNGQSIVFDELYSTNSIIQYKRERVRDHLIKYLKPCSHILELNAGTGDDAIFLAQKGHHVHAIDISSGMQKKLIEKLARKELNGRVTMKFVLLLRLNTLKIKGHMMLYFQTLRD